MVAVGTSSEELELQETLTATVQTAVSIEEDSMQDSGGSETMISTTAKKSEGEETTEQKATVSLQLEKECNQSTKKQSQKV